MTIARWGLKVIGQGQPSRSWVKLMRSVRPRSRTVVRLRRIWLGNRIQRQSHASSADVFGHSAAVEVSNTSMSGAQLSTMLLMMLMWYNVEFLRFLGCFSSGETPKRRQNGIHTLWPSYATMLGGYVGHFGVHYSIGYVTWILVTFIHQMAAKKIEINRMNKRKATNSV